MFVRTDTGRWNNLSRASAVSVEADRHEPGQYAVLAHYSGTVRKLRSFATQREALDWAETILARLP